MNTELSDALAEQITAKHKEAITIADQARDGIGRALHAAADVGLLVEEARDRYHGKLHDWLRKYVPTLSVEQAEIYRGIHKVRQRRECPSIDTRQLKLIGIIGDDDLAEQGGTSTGQRADGSRAIKWLSHAEQHYRELDAVRPIENWESYERRALADTLLPIVALFKRAGGVL
jgi:hypothetical protein